MNDIFDDLKKWLDQFSTFDIPSWEQLPEVNLYSDQVLSFLEHKLQPYADNEETFLTAYMINNYVKSGLIDPPEKKKYSRNHLSSLFVICFLKQILSLRDIDCLLKSDAKNNGTKDNTYNYFKEIHEQCLHYVLNQVNDSMEELKQKVEDGTLSKDSANYELSHLALMLAVRSEVFKLVAQKIISLGNENCDTSGDTNYSMPEKKAKKVAKKEAKQKKKKMRQEVKILKKSIK